MGRARRVVTNDEIDVCVGKIVRVVLWENKLVKGRLEKRGREGGIQMYVIDNLVYFTSMDIKSIIVRKGDGLCVTIH